jgi:uncharacterized protein (DUF488 family)
MRVWTIGHGTRSADQLMATLEDRGVETLVDVRRFPGSRRNPQFSQAALVAELESAASPTCTPVETLLAGARPS